MHKKRMVSLCMLYVYMRIGNCYLNGAAQFVSLCQYATKHATNKPRRCENKDSIAGSNPTVSAFTPSPCGLGVFIFPRFYAGLRYFSAEIKIAEMEEMFQ